MAHFFYKYEFTPLYGHNYQRKGKLSFFAVFLAPFQLIYKKWAIIDLSGVSPFSADEIKRVISRARYCYNKEWFTDYFTHG